ncbi:MAG TPA: tRNA epoxyqueuosine(34) reductase QueG [Chitinophagaceae bacterium]|nr:tRNA epoxyqueuosine(34) reductase QueG [Chitinophagaceae bacterium]
MSRSQNTALVKSLAHQLGFSYCGIAKAVSLDDDARRLENWLNKGMHGSMKYMENHFDLRIDPTRLVPGARSVITLLFNYYPEEGPQNSSFKVSRYAYGNDYHEVIRPKLRQLLAELEARAGKIEGRGFVDSAPVLERSWALRSGLGWIGKNGNIINKNSGSYFFIATLITDLELEYDDPFAKDFCGSCTRCIDACPTDAIKPGKQVDGSSCISYFTIELKDSLIPASMEGKFENWMFGCDICQEVCAWNRFSIPHGHEELKPNPAILNFTDKDWEALTEDSFKNIFRHSPIKRTGYKGLMRNLQFIKLSNHETAGE